MSMRWDGGENDDDGDGDGSDDNDMILLLIGVVVEKAQHRRGRKMALFLQGW